MNSNSLVKLSVKLFLLFFIMSCGGGSSGDPTSVPDITPPFLNSKPSANINMNSTGQVSNTIVADGSQSSDAENDNLTYQWSLTTPNNSAASLNSSSSETVSFTADLPGDYTLQLIVNDGQTDSEPVTQVIKISAVNQAPIAIIDTVDNTFVNMLISASAARSNDPENNVLTYTWQLNKPTGSSANLSSTSNMAVSFTPDVAGIYTLSLTVNDGELDSQTISQNIMVSNVNTAPTADINAVENAFVGQLVQASGLASSDPENEPLTYQWTLSTPSSSSSQLNATTQADVSFTPDTVGDYVLTLTVNDGELNSQTVSATVTAIANNTAPIAQISFSGLATIQQNFSLNASQSSDAENDSLTYLWSLQTPNGATATLDSLTNEVVNFTPDVAGDYIASLTVNDGEINSQTVTTTISVAASNTAPIAQITAADSILVNHLLQANAAQSSDADGDNLTYQWTLTPPNNSSATLDSLSNENVSFTPDVAGQYVLALIVNDGEVDSASVTKTIDAVLPANGPGISFQNTSNQQQNNMPFTFAYVFKQGEFANNQDFAIQVASKGLIIPVQTNVKATYADGSIRHAIFSGFMADLQAQEIITGEIIVSTAPPNHNVTTLNQLIASNWDATVELVVDGELYTASAKAMLQNNASVWLQGSTVNEWQGMTEFKNNSNTEHDLLTAKFYVKVFGDMQHIQVTPVIEQSWAYGTPPKNITYDATIKHQGNVVYTVNNLVHLRHARWRKQFWSSTEPSLHIMHDIQYMIETKAIPNYDPNLILNVSEAKLAAYQAEWIDENKTIAVDDNGYYVTVGSGGNEFTYNKIGPMGIGVAHPHMPTTGARADIGPLPTWVAMYLLSQDQRAKQVALAMGSQAGSYSIHFRDKNTGLPLSIEDYPYASSFWNTSLTLNPNTNMYENITVCNSADAYDCVLPYKADVSHQPSLAYVPYLVTGDHFYLEELHFWANYNFIHMNPHLRNFTQGLFDQDLQDRAQAWSMRTLGHVAFITPDNHVMKNYFEVKLTNNLNNYLQKYVVNNPNGFGAMIPNYSYPTASPWMDDFFTWSISSVVDLGYSSALPLLQWKAKFSIQRMGFGSQTNDDYCWIFAPAYHVLVAPNQNSSMFSTIKEVYDNTNGQTIPWNGGFDDQGTACGSQAQANALGLQQGEMIGYSSSAEGFPSNLQIALAAAVDSGQAFALEAWQRFQNRTVKPDYSALPNYAIVPRN